MKVIITDFEIREINFYTTNKNVTKSTDIIINFHDIQSDADFEYSADEIAISGIFDTENALADYLRKIQESAEIIDCSDTGETFIITTNISINGNVNEIITITGDRPMIYKMAS